MKRGLIPALAVLCCSPAWAANDGGFLEQSRGAGHPRDLDQWREGEDRGTLKQTRWVAGDSSR